MGQESATTPQMSTPYFLATKNERTGFSISSESVLNTAAIRNCYLMILVLSLFANFWLAKGIRLPVSYVLERRLYMEVKNLDILVFDLVKQ